MTKTQWAIVILLALAVFCIFGLIAGVLISRAPIPVELTALGPTLTPVPTFAPSLTFTTTFTPAPSPTETPEPTATPEPTFTPKPTDTPFPTPTSDCDVETYLEKYAYWNARFAQVEDKLVSVQITPKNPAIAVRLMELNTARARFAEIQPPSCALTLYGLELDSFDSAIQATLLSFNEGLSQNTIRQWNDASAKAGLAQTEHNKLLASVGKSSARTIPTPHSANSACSTTAYLQQINPKTQTFLDLVKIAAKTPINTLSVITDEMQKTRIETWLMAPPPCAQRAQQTLLDAMELTIVSFMYHEQGNDAMFSAVAELASKKIDEATQELVKLAR